MVASSSCVRRRRRWCRCRSSRAWAHRRAPPRLRTGSTAATPRSRRAPATVPAPSRVDGGDRPGGAPSAEPRYRRARRLGELAGERVLNTACDDLAEWLAARRGRRARRRSSVCAHGTRRAPRARVGSPRLHAEGGAHRQRFHHELQWPQGRATRRARTMSRSPQLWRPCPYADAPPGPRPRRALLDCGDPRCRQPRRRHRRGHCRRRRWWQRRDDLESFDEATAPRRTEGSACRRTSGSASAALGSRSTCWARTRATSARWWTTATGDCISYDCVCVDCMCFYRVVYSYGLFEPAAAESLQSVYAARAHGEQGTSEHLLRRLGTPALALSGRPGQISRPRERTQAMAPFHGGHDSLR